MVRPPEHSVPPSQPSPLRHLGAGGPGSGGDRPMRVQIVVALVVALVLLSVPLYLWRRPKSANADAIGSAPSALVSASRPPDPSATLVAAALDGGVETEQVKLGKVWVDSCFRSGGGKVPAEQCDRQPLLEEALVKAVLDNVTCAPKLEKGGAISYALKVDYRRKTLNVFAGKSGTVRRNHAKDAVACVERSLTQPTWETLPHQHERYIIAVLATYPPSGQSNRE